MHETKRKLLAKTCGCSMSTVSRVLNHKPGVGTEMRLTVLANANRMHLLPDSDNLCDSVDLYVILPERPHYFWSKVWLIIQNALSGKGINVKYNCITKPSDEALIQYYLSEAHRLSAKAILLAVNPSASLLPALENASRERPLFFLFENHDIPNSFYFGSDPIADGQLIANRCLANGHKNILVVGDKQERINGVSSFCTQCSTIDFEASSKAYAPAMFTRKLEKLSNTAPFDAVVCVDGYTAQISLALQKLSLDIPIYGFESAPGDQHYLKDNTSVATVCQDIERISITAAENVLHYLSHGTLPSQRNTYIQSNLIAPCPQQ